MVHYKRSRQMRRYFSDRKQVSFQQPFELYEFCVRTVQ